MVRIHFLVQAGVGVFWNLVEREGKRCPDMVRARRVLFRSLEDRVDWVGLGLGAG